MEQKLNSNFLNKMNMKRYFLIVFAIFFLSFPAYAATDSIKVNIISPTQVIPGAVLKIRVSISNIQDISSLQAQPADIAEKTKKLNNNINKGKKKVTINAINYENPFQLDEKIAVFGDKLGN